MAFIRTKKIKGTEYAYIVENNYKKRGKKTKQKSKKYLGKVYRPNRINMMDFYEFFEIEDVSRYISDNSKEDIIADLIKLEMFNYGFTEEENVFSFKECFFSFKDRKVYNEKGNNIALAFNEGYFTTYALRKILNFRALDEKDGYAFAKMFVEAGISIPQDVFAEIFGKIFE